VDILLIHECVELQCLVNMDTISTCLCGLICFHLIITVLINYDTKAAFLSLHYSSSIDSIILEKTKKIIWKVPFYPAVYCYIDYKVILFIEFDE
jgi:hypothetical protein